MFPRFVYESRGNQRKPVLRRPPFFRGGVPRNIGSFWNSYSEFRPEMIEGSCHCGSVRWQFRGEPCGATACNCTVCRRYGALWAYEYEDEGIRMSGATQPYVRGRAIEFHFCPVCGCVVFWRAKQSDQQGRRRIAVNLRLAEPEAVAQIPIDHFDGLNTFEKLGRDGRCLADYWF